MFKENLKKQFAIFIIKDGLYSSEIITNIEGVFLERMYRLIFFEIFFLKEFFFFFEIFKKTYS